MNSSLPLKLTSILIVFSSLHCSGQNQNPVLSMDIALQAIGNNYTPDSLPVVSDSTIFSVGMNISLYDTTDIQNIEVKVGTMEGGSDLFSRSFQYDVSGNLGYGISYLRSRCGLILGLGYFTGIVDLFAEVQIQRIDGTYSPAILFNR